MAMDKFKTYDHSDLIVYTRNIGQALGPYEKPVILPAVGKHNPSGIIGFILIILVILFFLGKI